MVGWVGSNGTLNVRLTRNQLTLFFFKIENIDLWQHDYLARILNARVYEVATETPLQPAPYMSRAIKNTVLLKVGVRPSSVTGPKGPIQRFIQIQIQSTSNPSFPSTDTRPRPNSARTCSPSSPSSCGGPTTRSFPRPPPTWTGVWWPAQRGTTRRCACVYMCDMC